MSAHINDGRPRGIQSVPARARAAYRQHMEEGKTTTELAKLYGVSRNSVTNWFAMCRAQDEDRRYLGR